MCTLSAVSPSSAFDSFKISPNELPLGPPVLSSSSLFGAVGVGAGTVGGFLANAEKEEE